jgi:CubicO group peptidase (beta-lactamase class C family)
MLRHGAVALVVVVLCRPGPTAAEPGREAPTEKRIAELLAAVRKKHDVPALGAAIVNEHGLVAGAVVGVRKRGDDTPATLADQFHLGSDTKAMTAALLAHFVQKGDLRWDSTLGATFPDLARDMSTEFRRISLTQLLTHHAGLPHDIEGGWGVIPRNQAPREQRQETLRRLGQAKLLSEPGTKFVYSNAGYVLAGHMAEKAGGADWEELITKRLFEPLGMKSAGFGPMGTPGKVDQPWQHRADGKPVEPAPRRDNPPVMGPAGRVHCSLPDWAKFVAFEIRAGRGRPALLEPDTFRQLYATPFKDDEYFRAGWGGSPHNKRAGGLVLAHDGSNTMNHCTAWVAPGRNFAVLVVCNQGGDAGEEACAEARRRLLDEYLP